MAKNVDSGAKNILVYHVGSIGDTLVALPAFRLIRERFNDRNIDLLNLSVAGNLVHADLYEHTDLFRNRLHMLPPAGLFGKLRLYLRFFLVCLTGRYSNLYCFSPGMPKVLVACFRLCGGREAVHCFLLPGMEDMRLTDAYFSCLEDAGVPRCPDAWDFPSVPSETDEAERLADRLAQETACRCFIAFGVGGNQQACLWPVERYSRIIEELKKRIPFLLPVYLGGEADREKADFLKSRHGGVFLPDTTCSSLRNTIAFLRKCRCYIGNDCGSMHLAATAGIPCAAIFSAHDPSAKEWLPFGGHNLIFRSNPPCAGCRARTCPKGDPAPCLDFSSDEITEKLNPWLDGLRGIGKNVQMRS